MLEQRVCKLLMDEGLDQVGFGIPVHILNIRFEYEMTKTDQKKTLMLTYLNTLIIHNRGKPLSYICLVKT